MNTYDRRTVLITTGSVALTGIAGCLGDTSDDREKDPNTSEGQQEPVQQGDQAIKADDLVRTAERNGVRYKILFVNPLLEHGSTDHPLADEVDENLVFQVAMDTHSGDLTTIDWTARSSLRTSTVEVDEPEWVWVRESTHHPQGYFRVEKTTGAGERILTDDTDEIELRIRTDDGTASFLWNLGENLSNEQDNASHEYTYITNSFDGSVSVIDRDDRTIVETIDIADRTSHGIAAHPDGREIYVGDYEGGNVYVIETDDFETVETISVGSNAHGIDIDPIGRFLFVSGGSVGVSGDVAVIDLEQNEVVEGIETNGAGHVNFGPEGRYAFVSNVDRDRIAVVHVGDMEVIEYVSVGEGPNEAVASTDGRLVYTANVRDDSVSVIDAESWEEIERIPAGEGTHGIDVTPDGRHVWTANRSTNDVTVIDTETRTVIETIDNIDGANHLAVTPDGSAVYVTAPGSDTASVISSQTYELLDQIDVGAEPHEIAFGSPDQ